MNNMEQIKTDGGLGSGRHPKGSGNIEYSAKDYSEAIGGVKISDGKNVKGMMVHAISQAATRGVYPASITNALSKPDSVQPGNTGNRTVYIRKGLYVVLDNDSSEVVTVICKGKEK
jgi:hypothetical protein